MTKPFGVSDMSCCLKHAKPLRRVEDEVEHMPWLESAPGLLDDFSGSQPTSADGNRGPPMLDMLSDILALRDGTDSRSTVDPSIEDGRLLPQGKLGSLEESES